MSYKYYISGGALIVEDTSDSDKVIFDHPLSLIYYKDTSLSSGEIRIIDIRNDKTLLRDALSNAVDYNSVAFTKITFREFANKNLFFFYTPTLTGGIESLYNNSTTPLNSSSTFTGVTELNAYSHVMVTIKTDKVGVLYLEFSPDGTNWDSKIQIDYDPNSINPPQPLLKGPRHYRTRFENTESSAQTYLRLNTYFGDYSQLTSSLESIVPQTFGASVTRPIDFNLMVSKGLYQGHQLTIKDGINPDIDTGSTPEDVWGGGGLYTGFVATAGNGELVVSGADTGTVFYSYMESPTDTTYQFASIAISGAGTYSLGHNVWRSNYMFFTNASTTNVDNISMRLTASPSSIFGVILATHGQTFNSAYTVPQGHSVFFDRITGSIRGGNVGAYADCFFYYKEQGKSPILRLPFTLNFGSIYFDDVDYLIKFPAGTDFIPHIETVGNNNTSIHISYRILKVKE